MSMFEFESFGKLIVLLGIILVVAGLLISFAGKIPFFNKLGHLPGDIIIRRDNFVFYFPITTSILISLVLFLLFNLFKR